MKWEISIAESEGCCPVMKLEAGIIIDDAMLRKAKSVEISFVDVFTFKMMAISSPTARTPAEVQFYSIKDLMRPIKMTVIMSHTKYLKDTRIISS